MARSHRLLGLAVAAVVAVGLLWVALRRCDSSVTPAVRDDGGDLGIVPWCAEGLEPIAGGGCLSVGPGASPPIPLVLYLHGRYDRNAAEPEMDRQRRLARRAAARGFAVLALRGREGECGATPELATWFCWPSNEKNAGDAPDFLEAWRAALQAAEERVGLGPRYVLGFSNGGFFAALLASRGLFPASAFAIAHAGPVEPVVARPDPPPLLLLSADEDSAQDGMLRFDQELSRENWPHDHYARDGGHGLTDEDIDLSLRFFARAMREKVPLVPPLSTHRPSPHPREDAEPTLVSGDGGEGDGGRGDVELPPSRGADEGDADSEDREPGGLGVPLPIR